MGKGDNRRPAAVPRKKYEREWDRVFKKTVTIDQQLMLDLVPDKNAFQKALADASDG